MTSFQLNILSAVVRPHPGLSMVITLCRSEGRRRQRPSLWPRRLVAGSKQGILANMAKKRLSCSVWELTWGPGSSADKRKPPLSLNCATLMKGSAATLSPTCFMTAAGSFTCEGCRRGHLEGHLFIGTPLNMFSFQVVSRVPVFRRGCLRICRGHLTAGFNNTAGYGLVAQKDLFIAHATPPLPLKILIFPSTSCRTVQAHEEVGRQDRRKRAWSNPPPQGGYAPLASPCN